MRSDLRLLLPDDSGLRARLLEVKTMTMCDTRYAPVANAANAARRVDLRARGLDAHYQWALQRKDVAWCGTAEGEVGPMQRVLQSHGKLIGLVFGAVGEVSQEVADLVSTMARHGAAAAGRALCARTTASAVTILANQARRTLAMSHCRASAHLLLGRVRHFEAADSAPRRGFGAAGRHGNAQAQAGPGPRYARAAGASAHRQSAARGAAGGGRGF